MLENAVEGAKPDKTPEERDYITEFDDSRGLGHGPPRTQEHAKILLDPFYEVMDKINAELEPIRRKMGHPGYE